MSNFGQGIAIASILLTMTGCSAIGAISAINTPETHFEPCIAVLPETSCPQISPGFDPHGHSIGELIEAYAKAREGHQLCAQDVDTLKRTLQRCIDGTEEE